MSRGVGPKVGFAFFSSFIVEIIYLNVVDSRVIYFVSFMLFNVALFIVIACSLLGLCRIFYTFKEKVSSSSLRQYARVVICARARIDTNSFRARSRIKRTPYNTKRRRGCVRPL